MDDAALTPPAPAGPPAPIAEIAALAPPALVERLAGLAADLNLAYADNTKRLWRASWRVWVAFCAAAETPWPVLPASVESLRAFLQARVAAGKRRATLEGNLATLSMVHRLARLPWPLATIEGELMWRGIRRSRSLRRRQHQKDGLSLDHIEQMLAPLGPAPAVVRDARDAALIRFGYETQLRRSSIVVVPVEDLTWHADGTATVLIERAKEDQEGEGRIKALSAETSRRLRHWLTLAGITEGPLFRSTPRSNQPDRFSEPLSDRDVARIYKRRATAVGIQATEIAGHSTRIGAAQDMLAAGYGEAEIVHEVGWSDARRLYHYTQRLQAQRGPMARFLQRRARAARKAAEAADTDPD